MEEGENLKKASLFFLLIPPGLALVLLLAGSLFPLRLDFRTLQHLTKYEGLEEQVAGARQILYLSGNNETAAGQMATFTLRHLAFPDVQRIWLIPKEDCGGAWWGEWLAVDQGGSFFVAGRPPPTLLSSPSPPGLISEGTTIVCDSREVFRRFQQRLPALGDSKGVIFLEDFSGRGGFVFSPPRWEFSSPRFLRLSLLIGAILFGLIFGVRLAGEFWLGAMAGLVGGLALQIWLAALSWQAWPYLLAVQWAAVFFLRPLPPPSWPRLSPASVCVAMALGISLVGFLVRLDFDGDVFTHWLPMGRSFFLLGHHDPARLLAEGSMHAATYPPGYGIFLAMVMWLVDMDRVRSFIPGADTSLAILWYRIVIWLLNMAFLGLLVCWVKRRSSSASWLWLAGLALAMGFFPTLRGTHVGAETLLFPVLGTALILLIAAPERPGLQWTGLAIAGISVLIKWEAAFLVGAVFGPWFSALILRNRPMRSFGFLAGAVGVAVVSLLPAVIWKSGLQIENGFFDPPSLAALWNGRREWASLCIFALSFVLKSPLWIPLFLLLPIGWVFGLRSGFKWSGLVVPVAIGLFLPTLVSIYVFSNWSTKTLHIEQSLDRLLYLPALSCLLYFLDNLMEGRRET